MAAKLKFFELRKYSVIALTYETPSIRSLQRCNWCRTVSVCSQVLCQVSGCRSWCLTHFSVSDQALILSHDLFFFLCSLEGLGSGSDLFVLLEGFESMTPVVFWPRVEARGLVTVAKRGVEQECFILRLHQAQSFFAGILAFMQCWLFYVMFYVFLVLSTTFPGRITVAESEKKQGLPGCYTYVSQCFSSPRGCCAIYHPAMTSNSCRSPKKKHFTYDQTMLIIKIITFSDSN